MIRRLIGVWCFAVLSLGAVRADEAADIPGLDSLVEAFMAENGPPGMAIGVIQKGKAPYLKGFGVRRLGVAAPVDEHTLFQIGSVSKAFTAAMIARLVEQGKMTWSDPVVSHLPTFRLYDPWVTREVTALDFLSHRTGLGAGMGDLMFLPQSTFSRDELVGAMAVFKPTSSFRSQYAYNNHAFVAAGRMIEEIEGQSWEAALQDLIFDPLGMATSLTTGPAVFQVENRANPHSRLGPPVKSMGKQVAIDERGGMGPNVAPAGGIISSAADMLKWVQVQLGQGTAPGLETPLWSRETARKMWQIHTPLPVGEPQGPMASTRPHVSGYGLGWYSQDFKGHRLISHAGGTVGFVSFLALFPEREAGFVILQNSEDFDKLTAMRLALQDYLIGNGLTDWSRTLFSDTDARAEAVRQGLKQRFDTGKKEKPSLGAGDLAGTYVDAWYGPITVSAKGKGKRAKAVLTFPRSLGMRADLEHFNGDTYVARWDNPTIEPAFVSFVPVERGSGLALELKPVSPLADFSFDFHNLKPIRTESR